MISANRLREEFLSFFEEKGHSRLPSASLIPRNDPSLLLTAAGMVPFKPFFLGQAVPENTRVTTCQKCMRTTDIENVGVTGRHNSFFEMLGNFSFGDYFKKEAISWAWEFVTQRLKLPPEKLWATIYLDDDEAFDIWHQEIGLPAERIVRLGKDTNFWEIGVGPCGPCSEIFVDRGPGFGCGKEDCSIECGCDRFLEIWNLVFIQFHKDEQGVYHPLAKKSIDTGMGLDRTAAFLQGVEATVEIDTVRPILDAIAKIAGVKYGEDEKHDVSLRVITDHSRAITFMVGDGIAPGNEGRGYVLRRLLRRAVRHGRSLGIDKPFLGDVCRVVIKQAAVAYPELLERQPFILRMITQEEERFRATLDQGISLLSDLVDGLRQDGKEILPGEEVFRLYDTYGFPIELTEEIAREAGLAVDREGFERAMEAQRERARSARQETNYMDREAAVYTALAKRYDSEFRGYDVTELETRILAVVKDGREIEQAQVGDEVEVVMAETPFYAESGGQVADNGTITGRNGQFLVSDVQRPVENLIVHRGRVASGTIAPGEEVLAAVYRQDRLAAARNHTATHLLHAALHEVIGPHALQSGSLVTPERLRFDFTHFEPLSEEQLLEIERRVNEWVMEDIPVQVVETDLEAAREAGATALFEAKYGDRVRVVAIGQCSRELCGGTHLKATGQVGLFRIVGETGVAAGVRRIEAVTGKRALETMDRNEKTLRRLLAMLGVGLDGAEARLSALLQSLKELEKTLNAVKQKSARDSVDDLLAKAVRIGGADVIVGRVDGIDAATLRSVGDALRDRLPGGVIILGSAAENKKALFLAMVAPELVRKGVHAGHLVKAAAEAAGGGGGGRPEMAQAGARDAGRVNEALEAARAEVEKQLGGTGARSQPAEAGR